MDFTLSFYTQGDGFVATAQTPTGQDALQIAQALLGDPTLTSENLTRYIQDPIMGIAGFRLSHPVLVPAHAEVYEIRQRRVDLHIPIKTIKQCGTCFDTANQALVEVPPNGLRSYLTFTPYFMVKNRGTHVGWRADLNVDQMFVDWVRAGSPAAWVPASAEPLNVWLRDDMTLYKLREVWDHNKCVGTERALHLTLLGPDATPAIIEQVLELLRRADLRAIESSHEEARRAKREADEEKVRVLFPHADLSFGHWDCEDSPTGECVYDLTSNMGDDDCLYCHQPNERK